MAYEEQRNQELARAMMANQVRRPAIGAAGAAGAGAAPQLIVPDSGPSETAGQGIGQLLGTLLASQGGPQTRTGFSEGGMMAPPSPQTSAPSTSAAPPMGPPGTPGGPAGGPGSSGGPGPTNPAAGVPISPGPMPQVAGPQGGIPPGLQGQGGQSVPPEMLAMMLQRFMGRGRGA